MLGFVGEIFQDLKGELIRIFQEYLAIEKNYFTFSTVSLFNMSAVGKLHLLIIWRAAKTIFSIFFGIF